MDINSLPLERSAIHPTLAAVVSPNLAGYLLPVHADVPAIDAVFVDVRDPYVNSLGAKGVGDAVARLRR